MSETETVKQEKEENQQKVEKQVKQEKQEKDQERLQDRLKIETNNEQEAKIISKAQSAVLASSENVPKDTPIVKGCDFNNGRSIDFILNSLKCSGFQATSVAEAIERVKEMISWRMTEEEAKSNEFAQQRLTSEDIENARTTIFLGLTSNMISSGTRECVRYLCEHNMIDCIVTTTGAIEEDIMKCFTPHYLDSFDYEPKEARLKGLNRIGNLLVPNEHYCRFDNWFAPILRNMIKEQKNKKYNMDSK